MWSSLAEWWDSVELWLTQLWFPVQVVIVMTVLVPLCWTVAAVVDRGVDVIVGRLGARRRRSRVLQSGRPLGPDT